jgi:hypothetical protein
VSPDGTPVAAIGLKLIGTMIPNVIAGNCGGSGTTQTTAANANTQKGLGHFSQLTPLVKLRLEPVRSPHQAQALASSLPSLS